MIEGKDELVELVVVFGAVVPAFGADQSRPFCCASLNVNPVLGSLASVVVGAGAGAGAGAGGGV